MKYMLLFCENSEQAAEWRSRPEAERNEAYALIGQWFGSHADKLVATDELSGPDTARTVRFDGGKPLVTDGPFMEAKEMIGGYAIFDVKDSDEAVELASTWPARGTVEVRPLVER